MPKRDLYRILGVSKQAAPGEIKRAYRRIAFGAHPDVGTHPDTDRFREAHEAYIVLGDPARRRSYDIEIAKRRGPISAEAFRAQEPLDDRLPRRVGVEVILDVDEARFGCRVRFRLPAYALCPTCKGTGDRWALCPTCYAGGVVEVEREVVLETPPGACDGETFEVYLGEIGIENLLLQVRMVVT